MTILTCLGRSAASVRVAGHCILGTTGGSASWAWRADPAKRHTIVFKVQTDEVIARAVRERSDAVDQPWLELCQSVTHSFPLMSRTRVVVQDSGFPIVSSSNRVSSARPLLGQGTKSDKVREQG
jgi:hypothetical protein